VFPVTLEKFPIPDGAAPAAPKIRFLNLGLPGSQVVNSPPPDSPLSIEVCVRAVPGRLLPRAMRRRPSMTKTTTTTTRAAMEPTTGAAIQAREEEEEEEEASA